MELERNMGTADRLIRPTLAAGFIAAYASGKVRGVAGTILLTLAGIFILTSFTGSCPLYSALDINSMADYDEEDDVEKEIF